MEARRFPLVEIGGTPFEMGRQHGAGLRERIDLSLRTFRHEILDSLTGPDGRPMYSLSDVRQRAMASLPLIQTHAPDLVEEMQGIAAGSGFPFEDILALNSELDLYETLHSLPKSPGECSAYALVGGRMDDGRTTVGWNADSDRRWIDSSVLIRGRPAQAPPFLYWSFAGTVGRPGLNPHLAFSANGLYPSDVSEGIPYCVLCRRILGQSSTAAAIASISDAPRMAGMNYVLGDIEGNCVSVETTSRRHVVIPATRGVVIHTNHYVTAELQPYETRDAEVLSNCRRRLGRLEQLLRGGSDRPLTFGDLVMLHRDHANAPDSLCRHDHPQTPDAITLASLVMQPADARMWVAFGPPCRHEFVEYTL